MATNHNEKINLTENGVYTKKFMLFLALTCNLFAYYFGEISVYLWMFSLALLYLHIHQISLKTMVILLLFAVHISTLIFRTTDTLSTITDIRFFWGWLFFVIAFRSLAHQTWATASLRYYFERFIFVAVILLIIEFISINIYQIQWPNRPHNIFIEYNNSSLVRAYGFGGNASVTSVLVTVLCLLIFKRFFKRNLIALLTTLSATGVAIFTLSSLVYLRSLRPVAILAIFLLAAPVFGAFIFISDVFGAYFSKVSVEYFTYIYQFKISQISHYFSQTSDLDILIGRGIITNELRTGDFQALDFFMFNGVLGVLLFLMAIGLNVNRSNLFPIAILTFSTFHYHVIFSMAGQLIFAYILTFKRK